ncbi:hypothetical protein OG618_37210 (plasmid) [Kitasatospora sp. NBC_01246]|uniref:hypothetical protein n=1 Tax=Kitasatospora sp. NBC_01246 TaxID=2903570 RepID=UPI002E3234BA|nr:hypothetical protein [Kitasatospora sp. NBC_01246]
MLPPITRSTTYTANRLWLASTHGTETNQTVTLDTGKFVQGTHWNAGSGPDQGYNVLRSGIPLGRLTESGLYAPYTGPSSETQTVTITGGPTGGTFTLTFNGQATAALPYNASAATVRAGLEALNNIAAGDVTVTGNAGGPYTVVFAGNFSGDNVAQMTANAAGLTGGTTPAVNVTTPIGGGSPGATDGTEVLAGFLETDLQFAPGQAKAAAPLRVHGLVNPAKLPVPFVQPLPGYATASIVYVTA